MNFAGYEALVAAIGGLLVGALCMLWALSHDEGLNAGALFDRLFALLQALLFIRSGSDAGLLGTLRAKAQRQRKACIKQRVQRLQARLRELEGEA